jgi:hypothetical protein
MSVTGNCWLNTVDHDDYCDDDGDDGHDNVKTSVTTMDQKLTYSDQLQYILNFLELADGEC